MLERWQSILYLKFVTIYQSAFSVGSVTVGTVTSLSFDIGIPYLAHEILP